MHLRQSWSHYYKQENKIKDALEFYGKNLGLTFQIADDTLDYNSELKLFGKEIGNDFYEGKITLPIILLYQKASCEEKSILKIALQTKLDLKKHLKNSRFNKKYNIINDCYSKAEYFINLSSNSLSIFSDSKEKEILKN